MLTVFFFLVSHFSQGENIKGPSEQLFETQIAAETSYNASENLDSASECLDSQRLKKLLALATISLAYLVFKQLVPDYLWFSSHKLFHKCSIARPQ